jgi:hypothetical protein
LEPNPLLNYFGTLKFGLLGSNYGCDNGHTGHDLDLHSEDEEAEEPHLWDKQIHADDDDSEASPSPRISQVDILLGHGMKCSDSQPCLTPLMAEDSKVSCTAPPALSQLAGEDSLTGIPFGRLPELMRNA